MTGRQLLGRRPAVRRDPGLDRSPRADPEHPALGRSDRRAAPALGRAAAVDRPHGSAFGHQHVDEVPVQPCRESPSELLDLAKLQPTHPLPHAAVLEQRFGRPLGWIGVRSGPAVAAVLDRLGAEAATRGSDVFLRRQSAPVAVVAHEVAHALQARTGRYGNDGLVEREASQETEARRIADRNASAVQRLAAPVRPAEGLPPGAIALLRRGSAAEAPRIDVEPSSLNPATPARTPAAQPEGSNGAATAPGPASAPAVGSSPEAVGDATADAFAVPPMPELAVSAEQVAAHEAAADQATAGMEAAASTGEVLHAFADAPPSVKAQQSAGLAARVEAVLPAETERFQAEVPAIAADLAGESGPAPKPLRVEAPPAAEAVLEPDAPSPAPEAVLPDAAQPEPFTANDSVGNWFARFTEPAPEQLEEAIGDSLGDVQTTDPSVPRTPGPPPPIPLGGETDPARIAAQQAAGRQQADDAQRAATLLVVEGPGPEQVQPVAVHESHELEAVAPPAAPSLEVPAGPEQYLALGLPPEVQIAFDEQQHQAMSDSLAEATAQADEAALARDSARDEAVATAQEGAVALNDTARREQNAAVMDARGTIQAERQAAVDAQHAEVERVEGEAADRRLADEGSIDTQVRDEQRIIDESYADGERDIADKVAAGERKAADERARAEREAEEESWWDRAVSFVKDAFNALVSAIGDIFDAVRAAVNEALDALKDFALSVIDRVATFIKDAIAAFGEFLKFAVDALIGDIFPELAAELTAAIDTVVTEAQAAVDVVAENLKAGVTALVEGLRAGINAALDVYQAAITFAVSVVGAALTGDWGAVARMVLEAVLKLVGVAPESFYAFVGRAQETFDIIVNDPLGFLSHLVDALVGGVQGFADRFGEHLRTGIIEWLTGTLGGAGITLPARFDLLGVLDIARQVLGLTWERIRAKAVDLVGERNVARLEYIGGYITTLVTEGWSALWNRITADLGGLLDTVFDGIRSFLMERVVLAMIRKIPALFGPVGAIVQLVMTAWNLYEFLRDQLSRIAALVTTVVESIGDIARGILTAAVARVEQVLGDLVPIALDLLARLLGLGDLGTDVRKVIDRIRDAVDEAIDALIARVMALFTGGGSQTAPADAQEAPNVGQETGPAEPRAPLTDEERSRLYADVRQDFGAGSQGVTTPEEVQGLLDPLMHRFAPRGLKSIELRPVEGSAARFELFARASAGEPVGEVVAEERIRLRDLTSGYTTVLIATLNGEQIGPPHRSRGASEGDHAGHAETWLLTYLTGGVMSRAERGEPNELDVRITRSPCPVCQDRILRRLTVLREELGFDIRMTIRTSSVHRGGTTAGVEAFVDLVALDEHGVTLSAWDIIEDLPALGIPDDERDALLADPEAVRRLERRVEQVRRILRAIDELRVRQPAGESGP